MNIKVELKKISKSFGNEQVLHDLNLSIDQGEVVGIIGGNGCGKSVLFKVICGFEKIDDGVIFIRNKELGQKYDYPENVGALINSPGYIEYYTGLKNLQMLAAINKKISNKKIIETMKLVGLDPQSKLKVKNYSMGMKQKLGIAQAIMEDQDIVILDEPFNALDYKTRIEIKNIIIRLKEKGITLILTSHNHDDLEELCDTLYILIDGSLAIFTEEFSLNYFGVSIQ